jgi:hypothetical protein
VIKLVWTKHRQPSSTNPTLPLPPNLPRRHRLNPAHSNVDANDNRTNNPDRVPITRSISENDRKHDTAQISASACEPGHHAVGLRVHVRHERERQTVRAGQEEHEHDRHKRDHGSDGFGVEEADEEHHGAGADAVDVQERFLRPHGVGVIVCDVADDAAQRPPDYVHETEHRGPIAGLLDGEGGELFGVVGAENTVYGELGAEGAEVGGACDDCLGRETDSCDVFEGWLLDNFAARCVEDLLFADLGFRVVGLARVAGLLFVVVHDGVGGVCAVGRCPDVFGVFAHMARNVDNGCLNVLVMAVWDGLHALRPFSGRGVRAQHDKKCRHGHDQDAGNDKGDSPSHVRSEPLLGHERVVDGWHGEVGNSSACVTKASSDGVGRADDVLVEEACGPYLARYEAATKDADEESQRV